MYEIIQEHSWWISLLISASLTIVIGIYPEESKKVIGKFVKLTMKPTSIIILLLVIILFKVN
ncbi:MULTISPECIES: hypothetical protein [Cytobacillus]|uniref:Uncharacterized protein n=1 Tax=Cytobacillus horneckiae TaxID=549687 RepID=A0A2N0ZBD7_9BACI|nr:MULTISPECIES: hypothetical protein [Cytobacillus]MDK7667326.1 hypothetical protein [Cytobacillus oceanisediminis]MEC1158661.1 hypothetical protein [Cytobacillus horneckiae]PKG26826.1 hypothetical protein CWS20_22030 [Cytobacillus horneckiae]